MSDLIAIVGPTATGKSALALAVAETLGGEIISVDSMQVYRGMDIGTAKASADERARVTHHMLDVVDPTEEFTVAEFQVQAREAVEGCLARGVRPILVGGSGMHLRSVIDPMAFPPTDPAIRAELEALTAGELAKLLLEVDPAAGDLVDLANPRRTIRALEAFRIDGRTPSGAAKSQANIDVKNYTPIRPVKLIGIDADSGVSERIADRLGSMFASGLLSEVEGLLGSMGRTARQAVGYKELIAVVEGKATIREGAEATYRSTVALVKRQRTYFRRDPRISWISCAQPFQELLLQTLKSITSPT